ncbi:MAG: hypothetical protein WKF31_08840 [Thermoleophilaceae bacterium]
MGGGQGPADLDGVGHRLAHRQPPEPADAVLERLALDVLEHDVGTGVVLTRVDDRDHVGVRQPRHRARLAPESLDLVLLGGHLGVEDLDGHPSLEGLVERPVDGGHAPGADPLLEPKAPGDEGSDHAAPILAGCERGA